MESSALVFSPGSRTSTCGQVADAGGVLAPLPLNGLSTKAAFTALSSSSKWGAGIRVKEVPGLPPTYRPPEAGAQQQYHSNKMPVPSWAQGKPKSKPATNLQKVSHALQKGGDARHRHSDGGRSHARPSGPRPRRPQQVPQELRELQVGRRGLRGWRLGRPPRSRAGCGSGVGGAGTS